MIKLEKNIIPLPTCAYHSIGKTFKLKAEDECYVGFQEDESDT